MTRIPIIRRDLDGTIIDGTAELVSTPDGKAVIRDFRDLEGTALNLPPGSSFEMNGLRWL